MDTIFVLEDDRELSLAVCEALTLAGYRAIPAYSFLEGQHLAQKEPVSLAILDVNLPDGDGFSFCRWLRSGRQIPVLFLSANDLEEDILQGYDLGADDYVTKPFSLHILLKKIQVILSREPKASTVYDDGFLRVDFTLGTVQKGEENCSLTPTEYRILKKLLEHKGQLLTYSVFLDALWAEGVELMDKHALAVNMNRLRKKIETEAHTYIVNVYGMGYVWKAS